VSFIYQKKALKSIGLRTFERDLQRAVSVMQAFSSIPAQNSGWILYFLDHLGGALRVYDFNALIEHLEVEEAMKLLLYAVHSYRHHHGADIRGGLIGFGNLRRDIDRRSVAVRNLLRNLPLSCKGEGGRYCRGGVNNYGGLRFRPRGQQPAIIADFQDSIQIDFMLEKLDSCTTHEELDQYFEDLIAELDKLPYDTSDYQDLLKKGLEQRKQRINERVIEEFRRRLDELTNFEELTVVDVSMQQRLKDLDPTPEQEFYLRELFDMRLSKLRQHYLEDVHRRIGEVSSRAGALALWENLKSELLPLRRYIGKEYEAQIAARLDEALAKLPE
jgi:hypothetical protein